MRILVIDYISYKAHQNFNKIHLETFLRMGHSLHLVGNEGQFDNIEKNGNVEVSIIPNCFSRAYPFPQVTTRLKFIICLWWLRIKYHLKEYDLIVFPTYEPLTVHAFRTKYPVVLITHDGHYLDNKVKLRVLKTTPLHYMHICLNRGMETHVRNLLPGRKVMYVPHGICPPAVELSKPSYMTQGDTFLFCPINMKYKREFVEGIINNPELHKYLEENNIKLYVKSQLVTTCNSDFIVTIENNLSKPEYDYMIQNAMAVILPYDKEYMYRCSGIMFECVSRNTPVLTTKLAAMEEYVGMINLNMFDDVYGLISGLDDLRHSTLINVDMTIFDPLPHWRKVFDELNRCSNNKISE